MTLPVFRILSDYVVAAPNLKSAGEFNERGFDEGVQDQSVQEMQFIDSNGDLFDIVGHRKVKNINWLPAFMVRPENRNVLIEFDLEYVRTLSLDEMKERLVPALRSMHDSWAFVRDAESLQEIFEGFGV